MTAPNPNNTLYLNKLNEKLSKIGIFLLLLIVTRQVLKRSLYLLFSQYGQVIDIVALKTIKQRGQAFIVYKDLESSKAAIKALQGLLFFDKPLMIHYANTKSKALHIHEGKYMPSQHMEHEKTMKRTRSDDENEEHGQDQDTYRPPVKKVAPPPPPLSAKSNILFIKNLPAGTTEDNLKDLVAQYSGFKAVRMVPERTDIAFVEFPSEASADIVKKGLHGLRIKGSSNVLNVDYYSQ